jgi:hypothetical protein
MNWYSVATVTNSILANSTSGGNCTGGGYATPPVTDGGYNISDDHSCGFTGTGLNGDPIGDGVNPLLGGLANNGGPTETIVLESGSPAIDAIPIALCPATDQRGAPRPDPGDSILFPACDIGAFESGNLVWLEPSPLDFGTIDVGQSSAAQTVTLLISIL